MDFFQMNKKKHNVKEQLKSMDKIREEKNLLKQNQENKINGIGL